MRFNFSVSPWIAVNLFVSFHFTIVDDLPNLVSVTFAMTTGVPVGAMVARVTCHSPKSPTGRGNNGWCHRAMPRWGKPQILRCNQVIPFFPVSLLYSFSKAPQGIDDLLLPLPLLVWRENWAVNFDGAIAHLDCFGTIPVTDIGLPFGHVTPLTHSLLANHWVKNKGCHTTPHTTRR